GSFALWGVGWEFSGPGWGCGGGWGGSCGGSATAGAARPEGRRPVEGDEPAGPSRRAWPAVPQLPELPPHPHDEDPYGARPRRQGEGELPFEGADGSQTPQRFGGELPDDEFRLLRPAVQLLPHQFLLLCQGGRRAFLD